MRPVRATIRHGGSRQASSQDTKSLTRARFLLFPSTRDGTSISCIHSAFMLQESVAASRESNDKYFVAYFDVAKAFDSVWINSLFKQLYYLEITGRLWRILRKPYIGFKSRVRIHGKTSEWYLMNCGIHQGVFFIIFEICSLHKFPFRTT